MELDSEIWFFSNLQKKKSSSIHNIDETIIQIGNQHFWLWFCIEPIHSSVLGIYISEERNMFVARNLLDLLLKNMVDILYILMVVLGMMKYVM